MKLSSVVTLLTVGLFTLSGAMSGSSHRTAAHGAGEYRNAFVELLADGQPPPPPFPQNASAAPTQSDPQTTPWLTADGQPPPPPWPSPQGTAVSL